MTVDYRDGISILKLILYVPYFFASAYVCCTHGFQKSSGWMFLVIFCLMRIIGSSAQLATISSNSTTPYTIAAVMDAIGMTPLLLSTLGLLSRMFYSMIKMPWSVIFQMVVLRVPQLLTTVGGILCIVAATSAKNFTDIEGESTLHIGLILYMVGLVAIVLLTIIAWIMCRSTGKGERPLLIAVSLALPLILIRLIYSLVGALGHVSKFNLITGSVTVNLVMVVFEEILVVAIFTITGLKLPVVPNDVEGKGPVSVMIYRAGRGDFGTGKLGLISLAIAGVKALTQSRPHDQETGEAGRAQPFADQQYQRRQPRPYSHPPREMQAHAERLQRPRASHPRR